MNQLAKYIRLVTIALLLSAVYACNGSPVVTKKADTNPAAKPVTEVTAPVAGNALTDEQQFRLFLNKFKAAVKVKNKVQLATLFNFPLQTAPQWTNNELKNTGFNAKQGLISTAEFSQYFNDIFTADAIKLIPKSGEDDLSEIDKATTENYYLTLKQVTDKGSTLYELAKQYTQDKGKETSFGFVFGKVKGTYKVISYYRPWPLK